jgi:hypothetical protein
MAQSSPELVSTQAHLLDSGSDLDILREGDGVELYFASARERERVRLRREAGVRLDPVKRYPYSLDPTFARKRFCCVRREDDAVTRWFREKVREPLRDKLEVLPAIVIFRCAFNRISSGQVIFCVPLLDTGKTLFERFLEDKDGKAFAADLKHAMGGAAMFNGAYHLMIGKGSRLDVASRALANFLSSYPSALRVLARDGDLPLRDPVTQKPINLQQMHAFLASGRFERIGPFLAFEIASDLRHTNLIEPVDADSWANAGPGCWRGLCRIHGRPLPDKNHMPTPGERNQALREMRELLELSRDPANWPSQWPTWEMREAEHWACETDKFCRWRKPPSEGEAPAKKPRQRNGPAEATRTTQEADSAPHPPPPEEPGEPQGPLAADREAPGGGVRPDDPFDPAALRLDQSFESPSVKRLLTTVPVRKPFRQHFVRVHPAKEYRGNFALIEVREEREFYLLTPLIARELPGEFSLRTVFTAMTRQDVLFLWPVILPDPDGRQNEWHRSAAEAAQLAQKKWVRIRADMALGAYVIHEAQGELSEPLWPEYSFRDLLKIGFRDRLVDSLDHPVIRKLRGLV